MKTTIHVESKKEKQMNSTTFGGETKSKFHDLKRNSSTLPFPCKKMPSGVAFVREAEGVRKE